MLTSEEKEIIVRDNGIDILKIFSLIIFADSVALAVAVIEGLELPPCAVTSILVSSIFKFTLPDVAIPVA